MSIKPGYKTTEWWATLASVIFSGLFLLGIFNEKDQADELSNIAAHGIESCILISGQLFILYRYIAGRNQVKKMIAAKQTSESKDDKPIRTPRKPSKSSKSTKRRTTKARKPKTSGNDQD